MGLTTTSRAASLISGSVLTVSVTSWPAVPMNAAHGSLLVFSHGYRAINTQSTDLMEALASHGFVVASPEHTGNAQGSPPS